AGTAEAQLGERGAARGQPPRRHGGGGGEPRLEQVAERGEVAGSLEQRLEPRLGSLGHVALRRGDQAREQGLGLRSPLESLVEEGGQLELETVADVRLLAACRALGARRRGR